MAKNSRQYNMKRFKPKDMINASYRTGSCGIGVGRHHIGGDLIILAIYMPLLLVDWLDQIGSSRIEWSGIEWNTIAVFRFVCFVFVFCFYFVLFCFVLFCFVLFCSPGKE